MNTADDMHCNISDNLQNYLSLFPEEICNLTLLQEQISYGEDLTDRKNFKGHVTASGLIISTDDQILLIFHNMLKLYLQPGGHAEMDDICLINAAQREIAEETGLNNVTPHKWHLQNNSPATIATHLVPANPKKCEEEHYHHDFMFLFSAPTKNLDLDTSEVSGFQWINLEEAGDMNVTINKAILRYKHINTH